MSLSLSLAFLSHSHSLTFFLIDTKTARRVRQHSRRVVSFRLFRSRRGSVSLCALLIFLPLHRIRLCVYDCVCVCVFAPLCVCQLLILYKHTHACALAHTLTHTDDDGKRGTPRRWVEERQRERERKKEDHLIYRHTRWLLCCLLDGWLLGGKYILAFRSVPMTTMMMSRRVAFLRSYGDMIFLLLYLPLTARIAVAVVLFLSIEQRL
jgi:hypothetical protein